MYGTPAAEPHGIGAIGDEQPATMRRILASAVFVAFLATAAQAPAATGYQTYTNAFTGRTFNNSMSSLLDTEITFSLQRQMLQRSLAAHPGAPSHAPAPAQPSAVVAATKFTPVGPPTVPAAFAATLHLSAADQTTFANWLTAFLGAYDRQLDTQHEAARRNDLAGAWTFATESAYYVASSGKQLSDPQEAGLYAEFQQSLVGAQGTRTLDDARKQKLYEGLIVLGMVMLEFDSYAQKHADATLRANDVALAGNLLRRIFGTSSVAALTFTPGGVIVEK